VVDKTLKEAIK